MNPTETSSRLRILLVEDDEHDRLAFHRTLEKSSVACEITDCILAEEALLQVLADASLFDVVVIDHKLPGMSGLDLCKELLSKKTPLPLVLMTGRGSQELAIEALKAGVDDYIVKEHAQGYLDLLPVVLPEIVRKHGDRVARERAEEALRKAYDELEQRVQERTAQAARATEQLKRELTERKRAQEALRESEEKYSTVAESSLTGIYIDQDGKIVFANKTFAEIYGYSRQELVGMESFELVHPDDRVWTDEMRKKRLKGEEASSEYQARGLTKDGKTKWIVRRNTRIDYGGKPAILGNIVDVTESRAKEAQLIQASKMSTLGEMATGVAHELNQPLSSIQLGADFFGNMAKQGRQIPPEELAYVSEQMTQQVARAVKIINHMRQFGRKAEIQREKVDINQPLRGVFALLGEQLRVRGIKVKLNLEDDLPPVLADSNRLEQVFIDLVVNARDAMGDERARSDGETTENTLTVTTFQEHGKVAVTIADTGPGVPDGLKEKIFEPFFTSKEVGKGTGLGLSISYGIINDYDGTIELASDVEKGAAFKITFPACDKGGE
ncbi:MAG: PAS domain S-box protein [Deltaproteobacteria bacterium]|nr:PAS domain S-box protein [Deltaproteobacteria bacterium]